VNDKIRIGIVGFGNLGKGAEAAVAGQPDMDVVAIVSRRPASVRPADSATAVVALDDVATLAGAVDVMICCGGSKDDLPEQVPMLAAQFNVVDSFDTHAKIPAYFESVDRPAAANQKTAIIATGWDPGLFSLSRLLGEAILPAGDTYTFWGRGLSQGHSDAVRRVSGVAGAVQYTIPSAQAVERALSGERPQLTTRERHTRQCYVVLADGADPDTVRQAIITMPDYFADYDTTVTFIDAQTLAAEHAAMPHGGVVIRSATTADGHNHSMQFNLALDHNPSFTASVLVAYGRAAQRMNWAGQYGAKTLFDVAPGLLSPRTAAELRADLL